MKNIRPILLFLFLAIIFQSAINAQGRQRPEPGADAWVDSVFLSLTPDERIAQLIMIRAYSNRDETYYSELTRLVRELNLGGVCFFQGGPVRQAIVTNRLQAAVKTPLLVALDAEWGPAMRLDSIVSFPKQMTLGALRDHQHIYRMGREIALQLKRIGVHVNFAPVADVNNNPLNPVINARSFGENRLEVAERSYWYMKGMQDEGLIAVAKHFPGHGDTGNDSHYTLPVIQKPWHEIDSLELFPFRYLVDRGLKGMMIAHLRIPAIDTAARSISSLSKPVITGLLREQMGFNGMVITDGMDMKGLTDFADPRLAEVLALDAGNDILLLPADVRKAIQNIRQAISNGVISYKLIDEKCRRVLQWKYESGLWNNQPIPLDGLNASLNTETAMLVNIAANAASITLVHDPGAIVPLAGLDTLRIATLAIGDFSVAPFQQRAADYAPVTHFFLSKDPGLAERAALMEQLEPYNLVIAGFVKTSDLPQKNFGISARAAHFVDSLALVKQTILTLYASPYSLASFRNASALTSILVAYQDNDLMQDLSVQALFGALPVNGTLPVAGSEQWPAGTGLIREQVTRLAFTLPAGAGMSSDKLAVVDSLVLSGIREKAFPGAQVVVVRKNKVVYRKSFGTQDYENSQPVKNNDLYDLASLTKVLATTLVAMKMTGDGDINPSRRLSRYFPAMAHKATANVTIRDLMAHQAGFIAYIPFWKEMMDKGEPSGELFGKHYSINYPHRVADGMYLRADVPDRIIDSIINAPIRAKAGYLYSDLGFILLAKAFEEIAQQPFISLADRNFYNPLGLRTMGFNPRDRFSISRIAPTENDTLFRKQLVIGDVHDQTAALLGGVAGHAGLFSDALDVAVVMQMLLNGGSYGGDTLLQADVIAEYTAVQFPGSKNRRGAGFDKPAEPGQASPACESASPSSFGHSGFTGTFVWADPEKELVYVFLSNRVHPAASNNTLTKLSVRTRIQEAIYRAITE